MRGIAFLLRAEAAVVALVAAGIAWVVAPAWWIFVLALIAPDLSLAGKLLGDRRGALVYNAAHTYLVPALIGLAWAATGSEALVTVALAWALHIAIDRALGFGLKDPDRPGVTDVGTIGGG